MKGNKENEPILSHRPARLTLAGPLARLLEHADAAIHAAEERVSDAARVCRFLRGRLEFEPRVSDLYVASYPRSGTTWMQYILHLLAQGPEAPFEHISEVAPWWERSLALRRQAPQIFAALAAPRVFKTHLPRRWLPTQGRCVYVYRNGQDVAVSYYHLYRRYLGFEGDFERFWERFLRGDVQYGSWFKHVAGWKAHAGQPRLLLVPFEELKVNPHHWVRSVARFCGLPADRETVSEVVRRTSFERMKSDEDRFDHAGELLINQGIRQRGFLRAGRTGDSERYLSDAQKQRFARANAAPIHHPEREWRIAGFLR